MALTRMAAGLQSRSMLMNTVDGSTRASSFWERGIKTEFLPMMGGNTLPTCPEQERWLIPFWSRQWKRSSGRERKTPTRVAGAIISVSFMSKWDW